VGAIGAAVCALSLVLPAATALAGVRSELAGRPVSIPDDSTDQLIIRLRDTSGAVSMGKVVKMIDEKLADT
jgi:hypothetical protein